jgi:hypothetical protein
MAVANACPAQLPGSSPRMQLPVGSFHTSPQTGSSVHVVVGGPLLPGLYLLAQVAVQLMPMPVEEQQLLFQVASSTVGRLIP